MSVYVGMANVDLPAMFVEFKIVDFEICDARDRAVHKPNN